MRMRKNLLLRTAAGLLALAAVTASLLTASTTAKYAAAASGEASARVAKWDAFDRLGNYPHEYNAAHGMLEYVDDATDDPVVLLFDAAEDYRETTITLLNRSEVAARYFLEVSWDEGNPVVEIAGYDPAAGVVLPPDGSAALGVKVYRGDFKGLRIDAHAEQMD